MAIVIDLPVQIHLCQPARTLTFPLLKLTCSRGCFELDLDVEAEGADAGGEFGCRVIVTAWGMAARMTLAARAAPGSNEAQAALELLTLLDLTGATVTADAVHCHRAMAAGITARGGDDVLTLKGNQSALHADALELIDATPAGPIAETKEGAHDRVQAKLGSAKTYRAGRGSIRRKR